MKISKEVESNRIKFLQELRSGKYKKGCTQSDEKGKPIIETEQDQDGYCACAILNMLFDPSARTSTLKGRKAIGITGKDCLFIQRDLNDSPLSFKQIADRIENEVFKTNIQQ